MPRVPCVCAPGASAPGACPSRSPPALSPHLVPSRVSTHRQGVMSATLSPLATVLWVVVHALRTRAAGPPGRAPWWYRAPPAQSARLVVEVLEGIETHAIGDERDER